MALQVWLPLNGNVNNQGLADITATNSGATVDSNGKIGQCYSFDGSDDFINIGDIGKYFDGTAFSICFWIYSLENKTRAAAFSSYGLSSTSNFFAIEINSSNNNYCNNNLRFDWKGTDTYSPDDFITYDDWTHVCVTYDGVNKIKMYKDGELVQTTTRVLPEIPTGNTYYLGRDSRTGTTAFNGRLNDFRIYNHCLSPREIKEISKGLVLHYPLSMPGQENLVKQSNQFRVGSHAAKITPSVLADGTYQVIAESGNSNYTSSWYMTIDGIEDSFTEGETFTISFTIKSSDANTTTPPKIYIKSGMGYYSMKGKVTDAWSTVYYTGTWKKENSLAPHLGWSGLVGTYHIMNWKIERGSRPTPWLPNPADTKYTILGFNDNIEYDVSGYNHNGTKHSITYDSDTPRYQTCAVLDGTSYIKIDTNEWMVQGAQALTWSIWGYSDDWSTETDGGRLISCTESGGFNLEGGASGYLRVPFYVFKDSEGSSKGYVYYNSSIQLASLTPGWHLFTTTYSTEAIKTYVDGALTYSYSYTSYGIGFNKNARLFLGCEAATANPGGAYFNGKLSDFRLYYTTLSAEDVYNLYAVGASLSDTGVLFSNEVSEV